MATKTRKLKPQARGGLLSCEHDKRGQRFITMMDVAKEQVALLEDWEYAILVLCDGERSETEILDLMASSGVEATIDLATVRRCLKFFERKALIEPLGLLRTATVLDRPKTMAALQMAYDEWHKEPLATGQFPQWLAPWTANEPEPPAPSMEPTQTRIPVSPQKNRSTLVQVGSSLDLEDAQSLLLDPVVPLTAMDDEATDGPGPLKPNTQANAVLGAMLLAEPDASSDASLDASSDANNMLFAIDEAAIEMGLEDESASVSWDVDEATDAYERAAQVETVQVRAYPSDRSLRSTDDQRLATVTARAPENNPSQVFRHWVMKTRHSLLHADDVVQLSAFMNGMSTRRVSMFVSHLKALSAHLQKDDAIFDFLELIIASLNGRPSQMKDGGQADVAALISEVLRQAKADGVCPACLKRQSRRFLCCKDCGFESSLKV